LRAAVEGLTKLVPNLEGDARKSVLGRLSYSDAVPPAKLAATLAESENAEVARFGLELMTSICVENPSAFDPNAFFMHYAAIGKKAFPYVAEIMDSTDDDFCREWACELFCEIFRHQAPTEDVAKERLDALAKRADATCARVKRFLSDSQNLKRLVKSGVDLSAPFRREWSGDARRPMKLMELLHLLDSIDTDNAEASALRGAKVVDTYNFNYSVLGRAGGEAVDIGPMPPVSARLKRLTAFLKRKRGARFEVFGFEPFSIDDIAGAMRSEDDAKMKSFLGTLKALLGRVIRGKTLEGGGRRELELARRFDYAVWRGGRVFWDDDMITVRNDTRKGVTLLLKRKKAGGGGLALTPVAATEPDGGKTFHVPARKTFVWFVPDGDYEMELKGAGKTAMLSTKEVALKGNNSEVVVTPGR
jgi:hypothetical protein